MTTTDKIGTCIVAGHICLDIIPELLGGGDFATAILPGRLLEAGPAVMATGGTVSNTGQALHQLGIKTRLMGKIGDDMFGRTISALLRSVDPHLADGMRVVPGEASSYTIILSPPNTDRIFFHCPGTNDTFGADDIDYAALEQATLFHFGYPQLMKRMYEHEGAELIEIFKRARATGITTSLDVTMPDPNAASGQVDWSIIFKTLLPYVDIFTPSIEEILLMLRPKQFNSFTARAGEEGVEILDYVTPELLSDIATQLQGLGAKIILLKASYRGLYLRTADEVALSEMGRAQPTDLAVWANRELWAPIFETTVVGTTGAGDAAIAGLLAALLRGLSPVEALTMANAVGACNVEAPDAVSGVRSWEETMARVDAGWAHQPLSLDTPGWRLDDDQAIWLGPNDEQA